MLDPSKRFATLVLAAGIVVLLAAIAIGEHMGDGIFGQATERAETTTEVTITPAANQATGSYGPDWKSSQALAAAPDPHFPDPRVPPVPLPTRRPSPKPSAPPAPLPSLTPNIPVTPQTPLASASPALEPSASESPAANATPHPAATS